MFALPVVVHEEDPTLVGGGVMNEGWASTRLGLAGWPNVAESRDGRARRPARGADGRAPARRPRLDAREPRGDPARPGRLGVPVTCEVTPHHLPLTDEDVARSGYDTRFKMNPPLRAEADRAALVAALVDGTIDCVATDHAPAPRGREGVEFDGRAVRRDRPRDGAAGARGRAPRAARRSRSCASSRCSPPRPRGSFGLPGRHARRRGARGRRPVLDDEVDARHARRLPSAGPRTLRGSRAHCAGRVERTWVAGREVYARGGGPAK